MSDVVFMGEVLGNGHYWDPPEMLKNCLERATKKKSPQALVFLVDISDGSLKFEMIPSRLTNVEQIALLETAKNVLISDQLVESSGK